MPSRSTKNGHLLQQCSFFQTVAETTVVVMQPMADFCDGPDMAWQTADQTGRCLSTGGLG
jgi:hypothetical protein